MRRKTSESRILDVRSSFFIRRLLIIFATSKRKIYGTANKIIKEVPCKDQHCNVFTVKGTVREIRQPWAGVCLGSIVFFQRL